MSEFDCVCWLQIDLSTKHAEIFAFILSLNCCVLTVPHPPRDMILKKPLPRGEALPKP